jgi:zinc transport system substrate-binding protein
MRSVSLVAVVLLALAGCQDASKEAPKAQAPTKVEAPRPLVVASFYPLYEFARQIAGDRADVVSLVPPGVEPHDWEPAPRDVARVEKATLFIYNGAGFDPGAERLAKTAASAGRPVAEATTGLPLLAADHGKDDGHGHGHGKAKAPATEAPRDPHVWLDPMLAQAQVGIIRDALAKADPANAQHYAGRATTYTAKLAGLHEAYTKGLEKCARREIVVSHAAFTYLARRYKLVQVPVMGLAPQSEPSPAEVARVVRTVRRIKAKVIFFETLVSGRLADTLASEVGAKTMVLNPIEGLTPDEEKAGKDYTGLMEQNLQNLRAALECT